MKELNFHTTLTEYNKHNNKHNNNQINSLLKALNYFTFDITVPELNKHENHKVKAKREVQVCYLTNTVKYRYVTSLTQ
jgi:hypothetical protein